MAYPSSISDLDLRTSYNLPYNLWVRSYRLIDLIPRITLMFTVIQVSTFLVPVTTVLSLTTLCPALLTPFPLWRTALTHLSYQSRPSTMTKTLLSMPALTVTATSPLTSTQATSHLPMTPHVPPPTLNSSHPTQLPATSRTPPMPCNNKATHLSQGRERSRKRP